MIVNEDDGFRRRIGRIEELIGAIEQSPDAAARERARELIQAVLDLHGAGLARVLDHLGEAGAPGRAALDHLAGDELVGSLLLLHGLHPHDLETRVRRALDSVRPYLRSHGGEVDLLGVEGGTVRLRLQGSCHGCPSSAQTLKRSIEEALTAAAPDASSITVEGVVEAPASPTSGFVPVEKLGLGNGQHPHPSPGRDGTITLGPSR